MGVCACCGVHGGRFAFAQITINNLIILKNNMIHFTVCLISVCYVGPGCSLSRRLDCPPVTCVRFMLPFPLARRENPIDLKPPLLLCQTGSAIWPGSSRCVIRRSAWFALSTIIVTDRSSRSLGERLIDYSINIPNTSANIIANWPGWPNTTNSAYSY